MAATSRELVLQTLNFEMPERVPRQLWFLPWAELHHEDYLRKIQRDFPDDFAGAPGHLQELAPTQGNPTQVGRYVDEWGCVFTNVQAGVIGEVKDPLVKDWATDRGKVHIPREWLTITPDKVNAFCAESDKFVVAGCCPRPFEQLQFLRGTADLYLDLLIQPREMLDFVKEMHGFYCDLFEAWCRTDVDGVMFMDDWGSQKTLLIDPAVWRDFFKPLYRDYIQIARGAGKKTFMHSDGNILAIYPDLIEIGLDAVNSQVWCMGIEKVRPFAGQITFWGEIDRQHMLPEATPEQIDAGVKVLAQELWRGGGCIAQCEFGPGAKPENVYQVFASWNDVV